MSLKWSGQVYALLFLNVGPISAFLLCSRVLNDSLESLLKLAACIVGILYPEFRAFLESHWQ